jgi:hypothetical protein
MSRLFFVSCSSIGALEAATRAIEVYEGAQMPLVTDETDVQSLPDNEETEVDDTDIPDEEPDLADTIFRALTWGPLGKSYCDAFMEFLKLELGGGYLPVPTLAARLNLSIGQVQARFSKLSARLGRVATASQRAAHSKTALTMMFDIAYTAANTEYRLTAAGRQAVVRYLAR